jgi:hypothetical protein
MLPPLARKPQHNGLTRISQGHAALQDFDLAYRRIGSFSSDRPASDALGMSASLRSRPNLRTQARLLQPLGPYPDARLAVVAAMRELDEQRQPERVPPVPVIELAGSVFARKGGSGKLDECRCPRKANGAAGSQR